jgi:phosphoribosylaminoimidazole-succinocarboxamide synthase
MKESQKFPTPIFTPSTKAEQGDHDENISPEKGTVVDGAHPKSLIPATPAAELIGQELFDRIKTVSLQLYTTAAEYAESCGLILADTKFEFGLVPSTSGGKDELILVDEVLTPDSSRYWPRDQYEPGKGQPSFDKQYVRNALTAAGYRKGLESGPNGNGEGWGINDTVIEGTRERYKEAEQMLKSPHSEP